MHKNQASGFALLICLLLCQTTEAAFFNTTKEWGLSLWRSAAQHVPSLPWQLKGALIAGAGVAAVAAISSEQDDTQPELKLPIPLYTTELYKAEFATINRYPTRFCPDHHFLEAKIMYKNEFTRLDRSQIAGNCAQYIAQLVLVAPPLSLNDLLPSRHKQYIMLVCPHEAKDEKNNTIELRTHDMADYLATAYNKPVILFNFYWLGTIGGELDPSDVYYMDAATVMASVVQNFYHLNNVSSIFTLAYGTGCKVATLAAGILAGQPGNRARLVDTAIFINDTSAIANPQQSPAKTLYNIHAPHNAQLHTEYQAQLQNQRVHNIELTHYNKDFIINSITPLQEQYGLEANNILALMTEIDSFYAQFRTIKAYTFSIDINRLRNKFPLVWPLEESAANISSDLATYIQSRQNLYQRYNPAPTTPATRIPIPH